jgi:hypothetical protein
VTEFGTAVIRDFVVGRSARSCPGVCNYGESVELRHRRTLGVPHIGGDGEPKSGRTVVTEFGTAVIRDSVGQRRASSSSKLT